jgi:hypothetical protein
MINPAWLSGTYVVKNDAKEYSAVDIKYNSYMTNIRAERYFQFVAKYPNDSDYFRPILDALDFRPSLLELIPELIITEGKNDYYALKYIFTMDFVPSTIKDNIYPGNGKDKIEYVVGLYIGWGRNFLVLLDDDSGGRKTYNHLTKAYGKIVN